MVAKTVFVSTRWCSTRAAFQPMGRAIKPGFPRAVSPIISPNASVYMNDWYCSRPSSSQMAARTSCSTRRASVPAEVVKARLIFDSARARTVVSIMLVAATALLRKIQDFDAAAVLVGDVGLASVGQHRDARRSFPGRDLADDTVVRSVDHRDRVVLVVYRVDVAPVRRVGELQRIPPDRDPRDLLVGRGVDQIDLVTVEARDRQAAAVGRDGYGVRGLANLDRSDDAVVVGIEDRDGGGQVISSVKASVFTEYDPVRVRIDGDRVDQFSARRVDYVDDVLVGAA